MSRGSRIVWVVVVVVVAAAGIGFYLRIWPWLAFPPEEPATIAARWAVVEAEAGRYGPGGAANPRLGQASAALAGWPASGELLAPQRIAEPIARAGLEPAASAALGELLAWSEERGEVGDDCVLDQPRTGAPPFQLIALAHLAIRTASGPDDPAMVAALRLGAALRRHGSALGTIVGFTIAADAVSFARGQRWAPGQAFAELRPDPAELRAFPAREMLCNLRQAELVLTGCEAAAAGEPGRWRWWWSEQRWCERERLTLQWFHGRRYVAALAEPDLRRFGAALGLPNDDTQLPAALVLRSLWFDPGELIAEMVERLEAYDAYLATAL